MRSKYQLNRRELLGVGAAALISTQEFPAPKPPLRAEGFGTGIQRTMSLLAESSAQKRNTVRILFYGQSITEQKWWKSVADDLRKRFPHANLQLENRAIGGFASQRLVKAAEADLYSFYPDLLIFHVYGSHIEYENILRRVRERTTAEILMQTDHVTRDEDLEESTDPSMLTPKSWNAWMNHVFLPETARKYGAELCDQRREWKRYLSENHLPASSLLSDSVHLNDHGCYLMAELVKPHLRHIPGYPKDKWNTLVTEIDPKMLPVVNGETVLEFDGNRVDFVAGQQAGGSADIRIDSKRPSELIELYSASRSTVYPGTPWPAIMRIQRKTVPLMEEWSVTLNEASDDLKTFRFEVTGSKTGPDGKGNSAEKFVSKSGRVVIEPSDWSLAESKAYKKMPLPEGFTIRFKERAHFVERYRAAPSSDPSIESIVTIVQGLSNARHRLTWREQEGPVGMKTIRIYRPPMKSTEPKADA